MVGITRSKVIILYPVISCSSFLIFTAGLGHLAAWMFDFSAWCSLNSLQPEGQSGHCLPRKCQNGHSYLGIILFGLCFSHWNLGKGRLFGPVMARPLCIMLWNSQHREKLGFKPSSRPLLWREADHPSPNSGGGWEWELSLNLKYLEMKNAIWYHLISSNLGASARSFPQFPHEMVLFKFEGIGENRRTCTVLLGPLQSTMQGELMPAVSQCDSALICVVPCFWLLDLTIGYTLIYPYHTPEFHTYVLSTVAGGRRGVPNEAHLGVWYKLAWRGITKHYKHVFMVFNTKTP